MGFDNVYYYSAHFCVEVVDFEEHDEYGFIVAKDFKEAMAKVADIYRDDLMSVNIEYIGDTGIICINNKELADKFREAYINTNYGEGE